jgi:hypothetical protein
VKAVALHSIQQQPHLAISLLSMGKQTLGWGEPSYEVSFEGVDNSRIFHAIAKVRVAERLYVSSQHIAHQKASAKQLACAEVIVRIVESG